MALGKRHTRLLEELEFVQSNVPKAGEDWCLICGTWLHEWSSHVQQDGPYPGPIRNWNLLDQEKHYQIPKPNLSAKKDYHGVNRTAWSYLQRKYGGGPAIIGSACDLYSPSVQVLHFSSEDPSSGDGSRTGSSLRKMFPLFRAKTRSAFCQSGDGTQSTLSSESRRLDEMDFVKSKDVPAPGEQWYLIDAVWLQRWRKYVSGSGCHPGSICNWQLLEIETDYQKPKANLVAGKHYRGVSKVVWQFFQKKYGGGPAITSMTLTSMASAVIHTDDASSSGEEDGGGNPFGDFASPRSTSSFRGLSPRVPRLRKPQLGKSLSNLSSLSGLSRTNLSRSNLSQSSVSNLSLGSPSRIISSASQGGLSDQLRGSLESPSRVISSASAASQGQLISMN